MWVSCVSLINETGLGMRPAHSVQRRNKIMKNTLVVVMDLACFKAYRLENHHPHQTPRLELVEEFNSADAHTKLVDKVSDLSGRFPRRGGQASARGAMSDGERHNIELELRKRLVRQLAQRLEALLRSKDYECCLLAASREINHHLLEELEPQLKAKIEKNLPADLTKLDRAEILKHF